MLSAPTLLSDEFIRTGEARSRQCAVGRDNGLHREALNSIAPPPRRAGLLQQTDITYYVTVFSLFLVRCRAQLKLPPAAAIQKPSKTLTAYHHMLHPPRHCMWGFPQHR